MFEFIKENLASLMIGLILLAAIITIIVALVKRKKKNPNGGCGCSCEGCALSEECHPKTDDKDK
jgi:hypothetical protein